MGALETLVVEAGTGDDRVELNSSARGTMTVDLGDGADKISLGFISNAAVTISTGAGRDTVTLQQSAFLNSAPVLTDFQVGDLGDVFDIGDYLARNASNFDGSNPFGASGHLRLRQSDADALLEFDRDGIVGTGSSFTTLIRQGKSCDWQIRAGATGSVQCGEQKLYFACDTCGDLFEGAK